MYGIKRFNATINTVNDLDAAIQYAKTQSQPVQIYETTTGAVLYEYAPGIGLRQFLVD